MSKHVHLALTKGNMYLSAGIDYQKCMDDAKKRLADKGEETTLHYHRYGVSCAGKKHEQILLEDDPEGIIVEGEV